MQTKKAKMIYVGTINKKIVSNEELSRILHTTSGYEGKMKAYKEYWIPDSFIEENAHWLNWTFLCSYQPLSTKLIEKYHLDIDFDRLVAYQKVSQKTLLKFYEQINPDNLVKYQPLTEKFIERYHDFLVLCWSEIVFYQKVSLDFLIKHKDKFELEDLDGGVIDGKTIDNFKIFAKMGVI
jgi:hypothetical protein